MNLFSQLKGSGKLSSTALPKEKFKLSGFAIFVTAPLLLTVIWLFTGHFSSKKETELLTSQIEDISKQKEDVVKKAEEVVRQIASVRKTPSTLGKEEALEEKLSDGVDATWTSVMWKIATLTKSDIVINNLELIPLTGKDEQGRKVTLSGVATSVVGLRKWLEILNSSFTGGDFVMERQSVSQSQSKEQGDYPVQFNVTARLM